jgi:hypothetical protein
MVFAVFLLKNPSIVVKQYVRGRQQQTVHSTVEGWSYSIIALQNLDGLQRLLISFKPILLRTVSGKDPPLSTSVVGLYQLFVAYTEPKNVNSTKNKCLRCNSIELLSYVVARVLIASFLF